MRNLEPGEIYDQVAAIDTTKSRLYDRPYLTSFLWEWRAFDELSKRNESD